MKKEIAKERSERILGQLRTKYPKARTYDLDGRGRHFVCEVEPVTDHPEYDRVIEVIILSQPHKHLKMTQYYTVLSGILELHIGEKVVLLQPKDKYTIYPGNTHWAVSQDECWVEIYSEPGWTKEDHIKIYGQQD